MRLSPLLAVLLASLLPLLAHASRDHVYPHQRGWADLEVYDRTGNRTLPVYSHEGRLYVAGEPGHRYELRVRNRSGERLLAVTSVDGVNVISGETAGQQQSGYVLEAWDGVEIEGWRKSLDDIATFYFTRLSKSYAARTGRPHDVGVIGVALFREHRRCCRQYSLEGRDAAAPAAPSANSAEAQEDEGLATSPQRAREKLGTGHGHRESSPARYVDFQRASETPAETIVIYYDSRKNLMAQGVIGEQRRYAEREPNPFPHEFAPDP
jgi:hypothetical protein